MNWEGRQEPGRNKPKEGVIHPPRSVSQSINIPANRSFYHSTNQPFNYDRTYEEDTHTHIHMHAHTHKFSQPTDHAISHSTDQPLQTKLDAFSLHLTQSHIQPIQPLINSYVFLCAPDLCVKDHTTPPTNGVLTMDSLQNLSLIHI